VAFPRESLKLRIADTGLQYLTEGAYGVIFVDHDRNRVRKVYLALRNLSRDHCEQVFHAETEAFERAMSAPELRQLVPVFFGVCRPGTIVDKDEVDRSTDFLSLAFEDEFIPGRFEKLTATQPGHDRLVALFGQYGIYHLRDASVRIEDGKITKIIDFATRYIEPYHQGF